MNTFSERLRSERKRIGLTQQQFAQACHVRKGTQLNYELGKRAPDANYLGFAVALGVDIHYLITGQVTGNQLAPEERDLVQRYRAQSGQGKAALQFLLCGLDEVDTDTQTLPEAAKRTLRIIAGLRQSDETRQMEIEHMVCSDNNPTK